MFLKLSHQRLKVFEVSRSFVLECYKLSRALPDGEKFGMVSQLRRAALSVYLNFAEGSSRKSAVERRRYYEIARGSVVEIDALFDIAVDLGYFKKDDLKIMEEKILSCFRLLSLIIK